MLDEVEIKRITKFLRYYDDQTVSSYINTYKKEKEHIIEEPFYHAYLKIVDSTARLLRDLGIRDSLTATVAFEYLLWNGYLSIDHKLSYSISNRINNTVATGADIMRGKSVCLNNAEMLARVLRSMGLVGYIMGCNLNPKKEQKISYKPPIKRNKESNIALKDRFLSGIIGETLMKKVGNHAVVVTEYDSIYYIADPTTLAFASTREFLSARYIGSEIEIELKPWLMLSLGNISANQFRKITGNLMFQGKNEFLDLPTVKGLSNATVEQCRDNRILLRHFHEEITPDIETVCKTLQKK